MSKRFPASLALIALLSLSARPVLADVPDDKSGRILEYQQRHLEFTSPASGTYEVREGTGTASVRVSDRVLAERAGNPELLSEIQGTERRRALWQLAWSVGLPLGLAIFGDNFLGRPRPSGLVGKVPPPVLSFQPGNYLGSWILAAGGLALAGWGTANLGAWTAERFGWSVPNLIKPDVASRSVKVANDRLLDELVLTREDVLAASTSVAAGTATGSAQAGVSIAGEEGSAAFYLARAVETLRNRQGEGYRLYMVYTKDMADKSGKLQRGSWRYLFFHPTKLDAQEVTVPVFGGSPTVAPAPSAFKEWQTAANLSGQWKVDSPKALSLMQDALVARGIPWLVEDTTLLLYPNYGNFQVPLWLLDLGQGPMAVGVGIDAASGSVVDLTQAGRNALPGSAGANPSGTQRQLP